MRHQHNRCGTPVTDNAAAKRKPTAALVLAVAVTLTGCQNLPTDERPIITVPPPEANPEAEQLMEIIAYYNTIRDHSPEAIIERLQRRDNARREPGCTAARLRSAMLMTLLPAQTHADAPEGLLSPCLEGERVHASPRGALASLLARTLKWRARDVDANTGGAKLKSEVTKLRKKNAELSKQLDELKAIEESLQRRSNTEK